MQEAVVAEGVGKFFRRYADRPQSVSEFMIHGWRQRHRPEQFWALRDVNFRLARGRTLGIIGRNGAGKSTLLRLVGGVGRPTEGRIRTQGRIRALLDLGSSFHQDLTGRENAFVAGVVAGLTRQQVRERFGSIVAFAGLEAFIDNPVRTFSTGMLMRLAFSVAAHTDPDILLVDEVLAVGDLGFQEKCFEQIDQFKRRGCTILLVTHEMTSVERFCDEVLWLRDGRVEAHGEPRTVVERYLGDLRAETRRRTPRDRPAVRSTSGHELRLNENRLGTLELEIAAVRIESASGESVEEIAPGESITVVLDCKSSQPIPSPHFGVCITREDGLVCYDVTTGVDGYVTPSIEGEARVRLTLDRVDLVAGDYHIDVAVYEGNWAYAYDSHWHVYPLRIRGGMDTKDTKGLLCMPHRWTVSRASG